MKDDSRFLRLSVEDQRGHIARCLNLHPDPKYWPTRIVDNLVALRVKRGQKEFYTELGRMLGGYA